MTRLRLFAVGFALTAPLYLPALAEARSSWGKLP